MKRSAWSALLLFVVLLANPDVVFVRCQVHHFEVSSFARYLSEAVRVANASNTFALALFRTFQNQNNPFVSPYSLSSVLSMVYQGASNQTAVEMSRVLGYTTADLDRDNVFSGFQQTEEILSVNKGRHDFLSFNGLVVQSGYRVSEDYKRALKTYYKADVYEADFTRDSQRTVRYINSQVASGTRNRIRTLLDEPVDRSTRMLLINGVYFKGMWQTKFDARSTTPELFYNDGVSPVLVNMMKLRARLLYTQIPSLDCQVLDLPYDGFSLRMTILLPKHPDGLLRLEETLEAGHLHEMASSLNVRNVKVSLPRFSIESSYDLKNSLQELGMIAAFSPEYANFSIISEKPDLYINDVIHKAVIDVNEEGAQAASATGVGAGVRIGLPRALDFTVKHPFLFLIRDGRTGLILFVGHLNRFENQSLR